MSTMNAEKVTRMSADERRELILQAATRAFAQGHAANNALL